jgi:GTPase SAR1 family protein
MVINAQWNIHGYYLRWGFPAMMRGRGKPHGMVLVFDITNKGHRDLSGPYTNILNLIISESFDNLRNSMEKIKEAYDLRDHPIPGVLVGNKVDLLEKRVVDISLARVSTCRYFTTLCTHPVCIARKEFAEENDMDFIETSAKESINVESLVLALAKRVVEQ